jgi:hypothetical protein
MQLNRTSIVKLEALEWIDIPCLRCSACGKVGRLPFLKASSHVTSHALCGFIRNKQTFQLTTVRMQ